jgi:DNA repair exonuclease SbcCD nuclease subunit
MNTRLKGQEELLYRIRDSAKEHEVDLIVFNGDLFHTHGTLHSSVLQVAFRGFSALAKAAPVILLTGNHDVADKEGRISSIEWLSAIPGVDVVPMHEQVHRRIYGVPLSFFSFTESKKDLQNFLNRCPDDSIVFIHQGVKGMSGTDFVLQSEILDDTIVPNTIRRIFTGHYHRHANSKHITVVGSPMQFNWSDMYNEKGWLIIDTDTPKYFLNVYDDKSPVFVDSRALLFSNKSNWYAGNFVRVFDEREKREAIDKGALAVQMVPHERTIDTRTHASERLKTLSLNETVKAYMAIKEVDGDLKNTGEKIMESKYQWQRE